MVYGQATLLSCATCQLLPTVRFHVCNSWQVVQNMYCEKTVTQDSGIGQQARGIGVQDSVLGQQGMCCNCKTVTYGECNSNLLYSIHSDCSPVSR